MHRPRAAIRHEPEVTDARARFVQTTGGRTGLPAPRRVNRPPFVQFKAPTVWTTLALTINRQEAYGPLIPAIGVTPFFLAGALYPLSVLPAGLQQAAYALPWTHATAPSDASPTFSLPITIAIAPSDDGHTSR